MSAKAKKVEVEQGAVEKHGTGEKAAVEIKVTAAQQKKLDDMGTTSQRIRFLDSEGYTRSQVAKILGKRYQHVRNVLITPVTKTKES